jgi:GNAT superfamily N-acetyltransferase
VSGELSTGTDLVVRSYVDADEAEVLELLRGSLGEGPGGRRTSEYFRWKHVDNHFGRSYMTVAEKAGRIIGFRALMRWRFVIGEDTVAAVRPVDTVTHPEERGRGVFSKLTRAAIDALRDEADLVYNTPNSNSLPGYVKMGWRVAGRIPVAVRVRKPARFAAGKLRHGRSEAQPVVRPQVAAPTAGDVLSDDATVEELLRSCELPSSGYATPRSAGYLRWRYGRAPLLGYHGLLREWGGVPVGLILFRPRAEGSLWGLSVGDLLVRPGDVRTARGLLRDAGRSAAAAYVAAAFPSGSTAARAHHGPATITAPHGMTFVVNPLRSDLVPDPTKLSSWSLSTGDVEVF